MKLKLTISFLLPATLMLVLVACGDVPEPTLVPPTATPAIEATVQAQLKEEIAAVTPTPSPTPLPTAKTPPNTPVPPSIPMPTPTPTSIPVETTPSIDPTNEGQDVVFWNEPLYSDMPKCTADFRFTHRLVDPEDITQTMFGTGSHISPHDHMVYWGVWPLGHSGRQQAEIEPPPGEKRLIAERVQLYAPADFFYIRLGKETRSTPEGKSYVEWGSTFATCNGHRVGFGHIAEPSDELLAILDKEEMECEGLHCRWEFRGFIPAGMPIFRSSGYTGAFDFALMLAGLTSEELQQQHGYGYSITPWRVAAGNAVCPLEYFPEPTRSEYLDLLRDGGRMGSRLLECGPFNQDVPGTAMGAWFPSPSPNEVPPQLRSRVVDEWETIWLHQYPAPSMHALTVGNNTFGLDYNEAHYSFSTAQDGLINQRWDSIRPGSIYCTELYRNTNIIGEGQAVHKILLTSLSEDGTELTIEALGGEECGTGPWEFQGGERTFYR